MCGAAIYFSTVGVAGAVALCGRAAGATLPTGAAAHGPRSNLDLKQYIQCALCCAPGTARRDQKVCTSQSRRRRLVCLVLGSAGAGRGQAMGRTGICSACYAIDQDRRRRGWRRQHLAQPRSRTGRALRTAVRWPGYRPRLRARSAHATTTRTGIRGEQLGGQIDPGSGDSP